MFWLSDNLKEFCFTSLGQSQLCLKNNPGVHMVRIFMYSISTFHVGY